MDRLPRSGPFGAQQKLHILSELHAGGKTQEEIAAQYGISRVSLHNWKKQLLNRGTLEASYKKGDAHYKALSSDTTMAVLNAISAHPEYSVAQLYIYLHDVLSVAVSYGSIQSILERYNLRHNADRIVYAAQYPKIADAPSEVAPAVDPVVSTPKLTPQTMPAPPPVVDFISPEVSPPAFQPVTLPELALAKSPQKSSFPLAFTLSLFVGAIFSFLYFNLVLGLSIAITLGQAIGMFFAFAALTFGSFFFVYSLKYYLSVVKVLLFSRKAGTESQKMSANQSFGQNIKPGLMPDLENITLSRHPFVSIHLPLYNEKRVVHRLLEAVTSLSYDNYEVIVCDDSTDETTALVMEWKNHPRIKISHRESRDGYKGAALKQALTLMDERTEFVVVFDADFLPYPDTIEQFLKYFKISGYEFDGNVVKQSSTAAVQGYQWHVLNKSENWITRGVRTEYAGSYVIERSGTEVYGGLKQIAGSVFMIRADLLKDARYIWGRSITEDFELTLKLYRDGYKVVYTPYIQAPSECVSTLKRLIRQRMRWAEGHSFNIKKHFASLLGKNGRLTFSEKVEFVYLSPYYLQSFFFVLGTVCWFISEVIFRVRLPLWTAVWGWSLVLTNLVSLPLMNTVGLFLEEAEGKDYAGIPSFLLLSYILAPFQAYAAVKGFVESEEGPWFRTPKTGRITDTLTRGKFYRWLTGLFAPAQRAPVVSLSPIYVPKLQFNLSFSGSTSHRNVSNRAKFISRTFLILLLIVTISLTSLPRAIPSVEATNPADSKWYARDINVGTNTDQFSRAISCPSADNCKIIYADVTNTDFIFFDCDDIYCATGTRTVLDNTIEGLASSLYCVASDDCKIVMEDADTSNSFIDCDNETCSSNTNSTLDGTTGCTLTNCLSTRSVGSYNSIFCISSTDCKVAYRDATGSATRFADCDNSACTTGTISIVDGTTSCGLTNCDTTLNTGIYSHIYCVASDDCKMVYMDTGNTALLFADCSDATCSTGTVSKLEGQTSCVLTNCVQTDDAGYYPSLYCVATDDCKISYFNNTNLALRFADCSTATCSAGTVTKPDGDASCTLTNCSTTAVTGAFTSVYCLSATDCKIAYYDSTNSGLMFGDCDDATCSSGTTTKVDGMTSCTLTNCDTTTDPAHFYNTMYCVSATDCKIAYRDDTNGNAVFADCDSATCNSGTTVIVDGNKLINATTGTAVTTKTFGSASQTYMLVSDVAYPNGASAGSLSTGTYTLNLRFTNNITSGTLSWNYEVGHCTVASNCGTRTASATSADQNFTNATTSPQSVQATAGSSTSIPLPAYSNWLYIRFTVVSAATGTINIRMNHSAANTADTYIDMPTLSVPELILIFLPIGIIAPLFMMHLRKRRRQKQTAQKGYASLELPQKMRRMFYDTGPPG